MKNDYGFEDVAQEHLGLMIDPKTELEKMVCYEAYAAFASSEVLEEKLKKRNVEAFYRNRDAACIYSVPHGAEWGACRSRRTENYGEQLGGKIVQLEKEIYELAGEEFNINSPKQLGWSFLNICPSQMERRRKQDIRRQQTYWISWHRIILIVAKILEYRQLAKLEIDLCRWACRVYS